MGVSHRGVLAYFQPLFDIVDKTLAGEIVIAVNFIDKITHIVQNQQKENPFLFTVWQVSYRIVVVLLLKRYFQGAHRASTTVGAILMHRTQLRVSGKLEQYMKERRPIVDFLPGLKEVLVLLESAMSDTSLNGHSDDDRSTDDVLTTNEDVVIDDMPDLDAHEDAKL